MDKTQAIRVLDVFMTVTKREILSRKVFKAPKNDDSFTAITEATEFLKKNGYNVGSMQRDNPIAIAPANKYEYIAKWGNIDPSEWKNIAGLLLSDNFRGADVELLMFD